MRFRMAEFDGRKWWAIAGVYDWWTVGPLMKELKRRIEAIP